MMSLKDRFRQIIKLPLTGLAFIPLAVSLARMKSALVHLRRATRRTAHPVRPAQVTDNFVTLGILDQSLDMDQHGAPPNKPLGLSYLNLLETN
jgi:hypothetical protein